jgi:hypothetical protein
MGGAGLAVGGEAGDLWAARQATWGGEAGDLGRF